MLRIGHNAFLKCMNLKRISLPEGLRTIGEYCFQSTGLREVVIPNSVETIMEAAFSACYSLESVTLPEGIHTIAKNCFWESGLKELSIP